MTGESAPAGEATFLEAARRDGDLDALAGGITRLGLVPEWRQAATTAGQALLDERAEVAA